MTEVANGGIFRLQVDNMKKIINTHVMCQRLLALPVLIISLLLFGGGADALLPFTASDLRMVNLGQHYRDPNIKLNPVASCSTQLSSINNNVFFIGDSLTFGMTVLGDLLGKANEGGFGANKEFDQVVPPGASPDARKTRVIGGSVEATEGYRVQQTIQNLSEHPGDLSDTYAGIIVVGLGTNTETNTAQSVKDMLEYIRGINKTADIYWVNTYFKPDEGTYKDINEQIQKVADETKDFTVIDFASEAENSTDYPFNSDKIHHPAKGYENKAQFIVDQLKAGPGGKSSSCTKNSSGDNEKDAFNYLKEKYGPIIAAGIIANFRHESGSNPVRMQCIYSVKNGEEKGIDASILDPDGGVRLKNFDAVLAKLVTPDGKYCNLSKVSSVGWGIVQWTPFSKMIDPSKAAGVPDELIEDLYYQLDFVISQLEGTEPALSANIALKGVGDELKTATTPERAAEIFAVRYEGCRDCGEGESQYAARGAEAIDVLTRYGSE